MNDYNLSGHLYIPHSGPSLLETPLLNKGSAFTEEERKDFNLLGLLPPRYETISEQVERAYLQYQSFEEPINKHIYLRAIQDNNETLFFSLLQTHIEEMLPIIYTPTVGDACENFSDIYRSSRGLFISYEDRHMIDDILRNATKGNVKVIVVTDGERVLGLGDQGIGGMSIPIGKLSLYTACGGISPAYTLPVMLDVGTNNKKLQNDPMYMGAKHPRIGQKEYDEFLELFVQATKRRWPEIMLQFEDFAQPNATPLLNKYREEICCFNDDIQGTAAVTLGTILAACRTRGTKLSTMNVVFVGSGSAGCGIAEMLIQQMRFEGLSDTQARQHIFMVDRYGLLTEGMQDLRDFQCALTQPLTSISDWQYSSEFATLNDVINNAKPDVLIGVSGQAGLFSEEIVRSMKKHCALPIIFPLSNPSKQVEATPSDIIKWTNGEVVIATGSPFEPVQHNGKSIHIAQCNNSYIFPGIGLGVIACKARIINDDMLMAASNALADASPQARQADAELLPPMTELSKLSRDIAFAVAKVAIEQGLALPISDDALRAQIDANFWQPSYRSYKRVSV
ncbi:NAD-dependent malic enzyme [Colwellia ponticola]|uniref:malate dehydrogenase (oxaloacetate-decarboxylating) n=1 Tax=Colwellia ponticola TaxID=2304625 RepID=A0A8H2JNV1_9GAMM|nr:NAD-dependent malic enzyme [Colwellia ponticola]TMM46993.1 NAD-dependent malic enzyme [Colwellia ponticola]